METSRQGATPGPSDPGRGAPFPASLRAPWPCSVLLRVLLGWPELSQGSFVTVSSHVGDTGPRGMLTAAASPRTAGDRHTALCPRRGGPGTGARWGRAGCLCAGSHRSPRSEAGKSIPDADGREMPRPSDVQGGRSALSVLPLSTPRPRTQEGHLEFTAARVGAQPGVPPTYRGVSVRASGPCGGDSQVPTRRSHPL